MPKFRGKSGDVEAVKVTAADFNGYDWDSSPFTAFPDWLEHAVKSETITARGIDADYAVFDVKTPSGVVTAMPGDWIIHNASGDMWSCTSDTFNAAYRPA